MLRDEATLIDIARCLRLITEFMGTMDETNFLDDARTQSAVVHQLLVWAKR